MVLKTCEVLRALAWFQRGCDFDNFLSRLAIFGITGFQSWKHSALFPCINGMPSLAFDVADNGNKADSNTRTSKFCGIVRLIFFSFVVHDRWPKTPYHFKEKGKFLETAKWVQQP